MLHCVPLPDAGAPAIMILGGVEPASIAIPLLGDEEQAGGALLGSHLLGVLLEVTAGEPREVGREETAVSVAVGPGTPNQLRAPAREEDVPLPTGWTKAESAAGGLLPSGRESAKQHAAPIITKAAARDVYIRRRTHTCRVRDVIVYIALPQQTKTESASEHGTVERCKGARGDAATMLACLCPCRWRGHSEEARTNHS